MYKRNKIGVSIPCYNEEDFIGETLKNIPDFIDKIYVVDDGSRDKSLKVIQSYAKKDKRIIPLVNKKNSGNGFSVVRGFKEAIKDKCDIVCIVAGDNQCRIEYLQKLVNGVVNDGYDYAKANRFAHYEELKKMPTFRKFGNITMSMISKFASGYYSILDPLNSYSATRISTLKQMQLDAISHRYDFENSFLLHLYLVNARIKDIPVPARYAGEKSDINLWTYIPTTSKTIAKSFFLRIYYKYILQSLHPLALFMASGLVLFFIGLIFGIYIFINTLTPHHVPATTATVMLSVVPFILGFQLLLQALVLDIQNEPK